MKTISWLGDSLETVRGYTDDTRDKIGRELRRVQAGLQPTDWKPMTTIGLGVQEIRIHSENEYRVIYVAKFAEAIYVLHAFQKKTQTTAPRDIAMATRRYRALANERK
jgi:phage-related protein